MPAALLAAILTVTACQPTTRIVETKTTACIGFAPITYSSSDTMETVEQIIAHNAAWEATCK